MTTVLTADPVEALYRATTTPSLVDVPDLAFVCIDGHGDPNTSPRYAEVIQSLYSVAYGAKFALRKATGQNLKVSPLEGLWWADDPNAFLAGHKADWHWTMMIRQSDLVTQELVERLVHDVAATKSLTAVEDLRLTRFHEGPAAQVLHVGPYATEGPTIARLHAFLRDRGFTFDGRRHKHHEIYLGDPRRAAPEKLRTLIRQPYAAW